MVYLKVFAFGKEVCCLSSPCQVTADQLGERSRTPSHVTAMAPGFQLLVIPWAVAPVPIQSVGRGPGLAVIYFLKSLSPNFQLLSGKWPENYYNYPSIPDSSYFLGNA